MDLNEGVLPTAEEAIEQGVLSRDDAELFGLIDPTYGFSMVHDRVFVTWFEQRHDGMDSDDYVFVSEPKAIELTPEEVEQFNDLWNSQMDQMQALLQGFVLNRADQDV